MLLSHPLRNCTLREGYRTLVTLSAWATTGVTQWSHRFTELANDIPAQSPPAFPTGSPPTSQVPTPPSLPVSPDWRALPLPALQRGDGPPLDTPPPRRPPPEPPSRSLAPPTGFPRPFCSTARPHNLWPCSTLGPLHPLALPGGSGPRMTSGHQPSCPRGQNIETGGLHNCTTRGNAACANAYCMLIVHIYDALLYFYTQ